MCTAASAGRFAAQGVIAPGFPGFVRNGLSACEVGAKLRNMTQRRVHWFWRAAIAAGAACLASGLVWDGTEIAWRAAIEWMPPSLRRVGEPDAVLVPLLICLPAILVAFIVYGLLTRVLGSGAGADGETRCRKCGYILRGISAPRCPECGERI